MVTVLITGGSGLVGKHLCMRLQEKGYDVAILSRTKKQKITIPTYTYDLDKKEIQKEAINKADFIIHLAGANIGGKRWTTKRKRIIIDSRVKLGKLIYNEIQAQNKKLKGFISASAIGYYGTLTSEKIYTETDPPANDFLGDTCRQWEQSVEGFEDLGIRVVKIRTGVVLTKEGGALSKMTTPVQMGIGSAIGNGRQYLPWIHINDLCGIYMEAIENTQMDGTYNAVAPDHKTNREFIRTLAFVLKKPFWFPNIPDTLMKLIFGEMAQILLTGSRISADKTLATGYKFLFPNLQTAMIDLIKNKNLHHKK